MQKKKKNSWDVPNISGTASRCEDLDLQCGHRSSGKLINAYSTRLEKTLESPLDCWRSKQSILKEINPEYSLEGLMPKLKLQYFGHLM